MPITGVDKAISALERQVYETAYRRGQGRAARMVGLASAGWPVGRPARRPHSRELFRLEDRSNGVDLVKFVIQNDARDPKGVPYAFFIRSRKVKGAGRKNAWVVLVRTPTLKLVKQLAIDTARDPLGKG
jgi:hypothetical protein